MASNDGSRGPYLGCTLDNSFEQEQIGYPKAAAALMGWSNVQLVKERQNMLRGSFDRMFGHNATKMLRLIEAEIAERGNAYTIYSIFDKGSL